MEDKKIRLTRTVRSAGWACKIGPEDLSRALEGLPEISDPNIIAGIAHFEDAGVYRLRDDLAVIQTLDFFTPVVDDPYAFGQIAAANAVSDVYAMGGKPLTALNIICFPVKKMPMSVLHEILQGGLDKLKEADTVLIGGHSVEDDELKYGLSIAGTVHPDKVILNRGAKVGDRLILTKPLGTGIISTALKGGEAPDHLVKEMIRSMSTLNRKAAELMTEFPEVHACTDITGFGFLGHACEMVENSDVGLLIYSQSVPHFKGIQPLVKEGFMPGGLIRNKQFRIHLIEFDQSCPAPEFDFLFDPQTSGGLLIALPLIQAEELLRRMHAAGISEAAIVGEVIAEPKGKILVF